MSFNIRSGLLVSSMRLALRAPFGREKLLPAIFSNQGLEPNPPSPPINKKAPKGACLYAYRHPRAGGDPVSFNIRSGLLVSSMRLALRAPFGREKLLPAIFSNQGLEPNPPSPPKIKKPQKGLVYMHIVIPAQAGIQCLLTSGRDCSSHP